MFTSKRKTKLGVPELYTDHTNINKTIGDKHKANVLADFFSSVFTIESLQNMPEMENQTKISIGHIIFTEDMVEKQLSKLNISKTPGPDGLHPKILKELSNTISLPLSIIFNTFIKSGHPPEDWKRANITATYKKQLQGTTVRPASHVLSVK